MSWNMNPSAGGLPFPVDQIIGGAWMNNPSQQPPQCPIEGPPPVQGMERNVLGLLIEYLQANAQRSPVMCFGYNALSANGYNNEDFMELLRSTMMLTGALMESGKYQRGSMAAEFAVERMALYKYVKLAERLPHLQDMDPGFGNQVREILQVGQELGQMISAYQNHLRQQQSGPQNWNRQFGGGGGQQDTWGNHGGGMSQTPTNTASRFGNAPQGAQRSSWGQSAPQSGGNPFEIGGNAPQPPQDTQINTDIFGAAPKSHTSPSKPKGNTAMQSSGFLDIPQQAPEPTPNVTETPVETSKPLQDTPKPNGHPTGNSTHLTQATVIADSGDGFEWHIHNHGTGKPPAPTWLMDHPHDLLTDIESVDRFTKVCKEDGSRIISPVNKVKEMTAGYELHELALRSRPAHLDVGPKTSINHAVNKDNIVIPENEKLPEDTYTSETLSLSGGALTDVAMLSVDQFRQTLEDEDTLVVVDYQEKQYFRTQKGAQSVLESVLHENHLGHVVKAIVDLSQQYPELYHWLSRELTDMVHDVLDRDYNISTRIDSVIEDHESLIDLLAKKYSVTYSRRIEERIVQTYRQRIGEVTYLTPNQAISDLTSMATGILSEDYDLNIQTDDLDDGDMGLVSLTRHHKIVSVPRTLDRLALSGSTDRGYLTTKSAPTVHAILQTTLDGWQGPAWLRTLDGETVQVRRSVISPNDWVLIQVDRIG